MGEWILENPGGTLNEMSAFFGYSPSWLSQVINSDAFKHYMMERMRDVQATITMSIPQRMEALAQLAIDKLEGVLQKTTDPEIIESSFDKVMHRYGYAPNAKNAVNQSAAVVNQQNNVYFLDKETFQRLQGNLVEAHQPKQLPPAQLEKELPTAPGLAEEVPSGT